MDNIFRPSQASLQACETTSALHDLVARGITKEIQNIGEQVWSKFLVIDQNPELQTIFNDAYIEKLRQQGPSDGK